MKDLVRRDLEASAVSSTNLRNQTVEWEQGASLILHFTAQDPSIDQHTRELAILIFKQIFKTLNHKIAGAARSKLYAVVCLQIAAKYEGKYDGTGYAGSLGADLLSPSHIVAAMEGACDLNDILQTEIEILNSLDFRILFATPISIAGLILHAADPTFDFGVVKQKAEVILNFCLLDFQLCVGGDFCSFSLAVAAVVVSLRKLGWDQFAQDLIEFIQDAGTESGLGTSVIKQECYPEVDEEVWKLLVAQAVDCIGYLESRLDGTEAVEPRKGALY